MSPTDTLIKQAERLYPGSQYLQQAWIRAVQVVRSTRRGWLMDRSVPRLQGRPQ